MKNGDLDRFIRDHPGIPLHYKHRWVMQIAESFSLLHTCLISHCDIQVNTSRIIVCVNLSSYNNACCNMHPKNFFEWSGFRLSILIADGELILCYRRRSLIGRESAAVDHCQSVSLAISRSVRLRPENSPSVNPFGSEPGVGPRHFHSGVNWSVVPSSWLTTCYSY